MAKSTGNPPTHIVVTYDAKGIIYDLIELDLGSRTKAGGFRAFEDTMVKSAIDMCPEGGHLIIRPVGTPGPNRPAAN